MTPTDDEVELHRLFTDVMVQATGMAEPAASQFMEAFLVELSRRMGSARIYVPENPLRYLRDARIRDALRQGVPADEVAKLHNVSERTVWRVKGGPLTSSA